MANSKVYGYYGSVYVPPSSVPYVPQPAAVRFTEEDRQRLQQLVTQTQFYTQSAANILIRTIGPDPNTFVLTTSGNPERDIIINVDESTLNAGFAEPNYTAALLVDGGTANSNIVDELIIDGGTATN